MANPNLNANPPWAKGYKYGVVITDNILSSQWGGHLFSLVDDENDVENGHFGFVGKKLEGERELSEFITPDATNINENAAVLIASPAEIFWGATPEQFQECYFINKAGTAMRGYQLKMFDEFSITEYTLDTITEYDPETGAGGATPGNYIVLQVDSNRGREVTTLTGDEAFVLEIIDVDSSPARPYTMILGKRPARFVGLRVTKNLA